MLLTVSRKTMERKTKNVFMIKNYNNKKMLNARLFVNTSG